MNRRIFFLVLSLSFSFFSCVSVTNYQEYFQNISNVERERISEQKVCLQKYDFVYPKPIYYKGTKIPNVFIAPSLIEDPKLRYEVSCYLMNKLDLGIQFKIKDYETFVKSNKEIIGECVYYLSNSQLGQYLNKLMMDAVNYLRVKLIKKR